MKNTNTPRVWVGCTSCRNNNRLVGEWIECTDIDAFLYEKPADLEDEDNLTVYVHTQAGALITTDCYELWCYDIEHVPHHAEMSVQDAEQVGDRYKECEYKGLNWELYCAYAREVNDPDPDPTDVQDRYRGAFMDYHDFGRDLLEDVLKLPPELDHYFDYAEYGEDSACDFVQVEHDGMTSYFYA